MSITLKQWFAGACYVWYVSLIRTALPLTSSVNLLCFPSILEWIHVIGACFVSLLPFLTFTGQQIWSLSRRVARVKQLPSFWRCLVELMYLSHILRSVCYFLIPYSTYVLACCFEVWRLSVNRRRYHHKFIHWCLGCFIYCYLSALRNVVTCIY